MVICGIGIGRGFRDSNFITGLLRLLCFDSKRVFLNQNRLDAKINKC